MIQNASVVLADDHVVVRDALRLLLESRAGMRVVGEADNGHAAVELTRRLRPDVVVLDIAMKGLNGIEAARQITALGKTRLVALSMHSETQFVAGMLDAGALAFVLKENSAVELLAAITAALAGKRYLGTGVTDVLVDDYLRQLEGKGSAPELTAREREVLQLVAEGHATRSIAELLHISVKTVETYRAAIKRKLHLDSVAAITKYAVRHGLTDPAS